MENIEMINISADQNKNLFYKIYVNFLWKVESIN